jgi:hypothetical protein
MGERQTKSQKKSRRQIDEEKTVKQSIRDYVRRRKREREEKGDEGIEKSKLLLKIYFSHLQSATNSPLTYKGPASTSDLFFTKTTPSCT